MKTFKIENSDGFRYNDKGIITKYSDERLFYSEEQINEFIKKHKIKDYKIITFEDKPLPEHNFFDIDTLIERQKYGVENNQYHGKLNTNNKEFWT